VIAADAPTVGAVRRALGINSEAVRAAVIERIVRHAMEEAERKALLLLLAELHDTVRRGRPLNVVANELRRVAEGVAS
jgi:hypothetical protein